MNAKRWAFQFLGLRLPLPFLGWILIGMGITFGDLLIFTGARLGSVPMKWLGITAMIGGPLAGIAVFVYHIWAFRRDRTL